MAVLAFIGSTDGDWAKVANWIDEATGIAPASLANGDTFKFDHRATRDVDAGLTTGLTSAIIIGTPWFNFRIAPGTGTALSIAMTSLRWAAGNATFTGNITTAQVAPRAQSKVSFAGGTITTLNAKGDVTVSGATVTNFYGDNATIDAASGSAFTTAVLRNRSKLLTRRSGQFDVGEGCMAELYDAAAMSTGTVIRSRGMIRDMATANAAGTVECESFGVYDASMSSAAKTIPTRILWRDAEFGRFTQAGLITLTNPDVDRGLLETGNTQVAGGLSQL